MNTIVTFARYAVVKTNVIWPFTFLNKLPYEFALRRVESLCAACPAIRSLYLRHGLTEANWEPGLSDIDLTVVISKDLSGRQEFAFLQSFGEAYRALKSRLPMLGEIDVLNERCSNAWTQYSIRGYETRNWRLLYGESTVTSLHQGDRETLKRDAFAMALTTFEEFFLPRFYASSSHTWVDKKGFHRIIRKIQRYASSADGDTGMGGRELDLKMTPDEMLLQLLLELEARVDVLAAPSRTTSSCNSTVELNEEQLEIEFKISNFTHLKRHQNAIDSVVLSYARPFIIIRKGQERTMMVECLADIRETQSTNSTPPIILTKALFEYFVQTYRPHTYLSLRQHRHILFGDDPMAGLKPPTSAAVASSLLDQSVNVMLRPGSQAICTAEAGSRVNLAGQAWNALLLKLYLELEIVDSYERCLEISEGIYPELCDDIHHLHRDQEDDGDVHLELAHAVLRRLAFDVNSRLETMSEQAHLAVLGNAPKRSWRKQIHE